MTIQSPIKNSVFLVFYMFLSTGICYVPSSLRILISFMLMLLPVLYGCIDKSVRKKIAENGLWGWLILFLFFFFQLVNQRFSMSFLFIFSNLILAYILTVKSFSTKILLAGYYVIAFIYILMMMSGITLDTFMQNSSRNIVSVICLCYLAVVYFVEFNQQEKLSVIPLLLLVVISVGAVGRGGIICSFGVFWAFILSKLRHNRILLILFLILILLSVSFFLDDIVLLYDDFIAKSRFSTEGLESSERGDLTDTYLANINFVTFLFGYNYSYNLLFIDFDLNPHNSFIRFHSYMGIFAIFFMLFLLKSAFVISLKLDLFMGVLLIVLLVRGWVDTVYFFDRYDFIIYAFLFMYYQKKRCYEIL